MQFYYRLIKTNNCKINTTTLQTTIVSLCVIYTPVVSLLWWSKSGTPVLTERPVPEGNWFKARAGHLRIDIQDSKHNSWKVR